MDYLRNQESLFHLKKKNQINEHISVTYPEKKSLR